MYLYYVCIWTGPKYSLKSSGANIFENSFYQPADVFPFSEWSLQFWFLCKISGMFINIMFIETLIIQGNLEILIAKITFETLMAFQLCFFHEFWQTLRTFEWFFIKQGFLLSNIIPSLFFICFIFYTRRGIILKCCNKFSTIQIFYRLPWASPD